jgi:hypothetical protein
MLDSLSERACASVHIPDMPLGPLEAFERITRKTLPPKKTAPHQSKARRPNLVGR